jgi:Spy/CpxP family protein refolding chaperone
MKEILTPEQFEKLKAERKEKMETFREKRRDRKAQD